jgi:hypothetical protein
VVRGVHGTLQDSLYKVFRHRVLPHAADALARLNGMDHIQEKLLENVADWLDSIRVWSGKL